MQDLFAAILSKGIAQQLKQGLHREYVTREEDLPLMRGRLDFNGTVRNMAQGRKLLACGYDELSEDNEFNRILKTTVVLLLREPAVKEERKTALKKEMLFFSAVGETDPSLVRWDLLRFTRNNQGYRMLLSICRLVLEGLLLTTEQGGVKLAHFMDDQRMSHLYEKFILEFYRREMPELHANASRIEWQLDDGVSTMLPAMQSDVMLKHGGRTLIIDAKYYSRATQERFGKASLHSGNVYQIFTYVKNEDVGGTGNVAGLLLYAKTQEETLPDMDVVLGGNRIGAKALDLNRPFEEIAGQLKGIAGTYFGI